MKPDERQLKLGENKGILEKEREYRSKENRMCSAREKEREELWKRIKGYNGVLPKYILNWLRQQNFKSAESMANIPHAYIVKNNTNRLIFEEFAIFIRIYGHPERFWNKEFIYYNLEGFKYWTMGDPIETTIILNRARVN